LPAKLTGKLLNYSVVCLILTYNTGLMNSAMSINNMLKIYKKIPSTNQATREIWEKKKQKLRWKMALFFVGITIVGFEISASGFSFTTAFVNELFQHSIYLQDILKYFDSINDKYNFIDTSLVKVLGKSSKILVVFVFAYGWYYFLFNKDPFSNIELLRKIHYKAYKKRYFFLKDIAFYAKHLPSNLLAKKCNECSRKEECENILEEIGDKKTREWCKLFAKLLPVDVEAFHKATYEFRKAFYLKYGFLFSGIILTIGFIIIYFYSAAYLNETSKISLPLIYIFFTFAAYAGVAISNGLKEGQGGAFRRYRENSQKYFSSEDFNDFLSNNLCNQISDAEDIKSILIMNDYLNFIIDNKLQMHCLGNNKREAYNKANIRRILQHLTALFFALSSRQHQFRTSFFILSDDQKYLFPFILDSSNKAKFNFLNDTHDIHKICSDFFSINKNSAAAEAWRLQRPVCRNSNIQTVLHGPNEHLKSIYCYPLSFNGEIYQQIKSDNLNINFGVLSIDCNNENIFSQKNCIINNLLVKPFAHRICYELSLGIYYKIKEANL
jgi:hypothetical protein